MSVKLFQLIGLVLVRDSDQSQLTTVLSHERSSPKKRIVFALIKQKEPRRETVNDTYQRLITSCRESVMKEMTRNCINHVINGMQIYYFTNFLTRSSQIYKAIVLKGPCLWGKFGSPIPNNLDKRLNLFV